MSVQKKLVPVPEITSVVTCDTCGFEESYHDADWLRWYWLTPPRLTEPARQLDQRHFCCLDCLGSYVGDRIAESKSLPA